MKINNIIAFTILVSATCFTGCTPNDTEIKSNVSKAIENEAVEVSVKDGVVTLSGEVHNRKAKAKAEAEARKVKEVQTVVNEIVIPVPPTPPSPEKVEAVFDEKLNAEVQAVIVPFPDVRARVNNGVVTLTGEITKPGLVLLMPKIAGLFPKKIENNLSIK